MPNSEREMRAFKFVTEKLGKMFSRDKGMMDSFNEFVTLERAEARRAAIEECAQVANSCTRTEIMATQQSMRQYIVSALRSKLAAPEKEDTNVLDRQ